MCDPGKAIDFLEVVGRLKRAKRTGWWENGVHGAEHVSSHMHRMAVFAMLNKDESIDTLKLIRVAVMHDVAEAVVGDLSPKQMKERGITKEMKYEMEKAGMVEMAKLVGDPELEATLVDSWEEYEQQNTVESHWIKDIDRLEMAIQAFEYEKEQKAELTTFYRGVPDAIKNPWLRSVAEELMKRRTAFVASTVTTKKTPLPLDDSLPVSALVTRAAVCAGCLAVGFAAGRFFSKS